jgi:hypothetical protein
MGFWGDDQMGDGFSYWVPMGVGFLGLASLGGVPTNSMDSSAAFGLRGKVV